jgi:hypothetical protein
MANDARGAREKPSTYFRASQVAPQEHWIETLIFDAHDGELRRCHAVLEIERDHGARTISDGNIAYHNIVGFRSNDIIVSKLASKPFLTLRDNPTLVQQLADMVKNQTGKENGRMSEPTHQG